MDSNLKPIYFVSFIALVFFIFLGYTVYQAAVVLPRERIEQQEQAAIEAARQARIIREEQMRNYDFCIADAYEVYSKNWDGACGLINLPADCSLPGYTANNLDASHETAKDRCVALYRAN